MSECPLAIVPVGTVIVPFGTESIMDSMGELFSELNSLENQVHKVYLKLREICDYLNVTSKEAFLCHEGISEQIKERFFDSFEAEILLHPRKTFNQEKVLQILYVFLIITKSSLLL
jgi:hypothetical protein